MRGLIAQAERRARVVVGDAGVAADAADDRLDPAGASLGGQLRVGDQRTGHPERLGPALGEQALGDLDIGHARGGDPRQADARSGRSAPATAASSTGGGGTIPTEPR